MKIGIVTFHTAENYGAVLQAWALQQHLSESGHRAEFVDYRYKFEEHVLDDKNDKFRQKAMKFVQRTIYRSCFAWFRSRHLALSPRTYHDISQLRAAPPEVDALICGSDQVWNPDHMWDASDEAVSWLDFGAPGIKRLSYAASFGRDTLAQESIERWTAFVAKFDGLSVRERTGTSLLEKMGSDKAVVVPDPTLLLDPSRYEQLVGPVRKPKKQVFAFTLGMGKIHEIAQALCASNGLSLKISSQYSLKSFFKDFRSTPIHWLEDIRGSEIVLTNSFHAVCFSLVFHRPFVAVIRSGGTTERNTRLLDLLERAGLSEQILSESDLSLERVRSMVERPIDWSAVDLRLAEFRKCGATFLQDNLVPRG